MWTKRYSSSRICKSKLRNAILSGTVIERHTHTLRMAYLPSIGHPMSLEAYFSTDRQRRFHHYWTQCGRYTGNGCDGGDLQRVCRMGRWFHVEVLQDAGVQSTWTTPVCTACDEQWGTRRYCVGASACAPPPGCTPARKDCVDDLSHDPAPHTGWGGPWNPDPFNVCLEQCRKVNVCPEWRTPQSGSKGDRSSEHAYCKVCGLHYIKQNGSAMQ